MAVDGNKVVGYQVAWFIEEEVHLVNLAVTPAYQKRRIGTLLLNELIEDCSQLRESLRQAIDFLETQPSDMEWDDLRRHMKPLGFEPGWGKNVATMLETMCLLMDIMEAPSAMNLGSWPVPDQLPTGALVSMTCPAAALNVSC